MTELLDITREAKKTGQKKRLRTLKDLERATLLLAQAIMEVGRVNKTLYLLNYSDDEDYRRRILTQLNRG